MFCAFLPTKPFPRALPAKFTGFERRPSATSFCSPRQVSVALLLIVSLIVVSLALVKGEASTTESSPCVPKSQQVTSFLEEMLDGVGPRPLKARIRRCCGAFSIKRLRGSERT